MNSPIKNIGAYFQTDEQGYIVNPTSQEYIPNKWQPLVDEIVATCISEEKEELHSIYLRGSVPRGLAQDGFADLDVFILVSRVGIRWEEVAWLSNYQEKWQSAYPFVKNVEVMWSSFSENLSATYPRLAMILKTQSLLLYGPDIAETMSSYKVDQSMLLHYAWLEEDLEEFLSKEAPSKNDVQAIAKLLIRCAFEIVMIREGKYTPDLFLCCQSFSKYNPQYAKQIKQLLAIYLQPNLPSIKELKQLIRELGAFISTQIELHIL